MPLAKNDPALLCKECKWCHTVGGPMTWVCMNPKLMQGRDPLEGKPIRPYCAAARQEPSPFGRDTDEVFCGPDGLLWEGRD